MGVEMTLDETVFDWTSGTDNPLDNDVRDKISQYLNTIRTPLPANDYDRYLAQTVKGKRTLDVGICEHTMERMSKASWKHNIIRDNAGYSLGLDIIRELVDELKKQGANVVCCDATSEEDLGETFDVIHVGDVIEHVNDPIALLRFCFRHLNDTGKVIVRTPNPFHYHYVRLNSQYGTDKSNLQHMFYICPTHMMEMARRLDCKVKLSRYLTLYPRGFSRKGVVGFSYRLLTGKFRAALAEFFDKPESYSPFFVYELSYRGAKWR